MKPRINLITLSVALALGTVLCFGCGSPEPKPEARTPADSATPPSAMLTRAVAITFDDLPGVAPARCNAAELRALNQQLLSAIKRSQIPVTGLVVGSRDCDSGVLPEILNAWLDEGHELGNHTYSHLDLNQVSSDEYVADVERGAAAVQAVLEKRGQRLRYFRHPLLHAGDTEEKKQSVDRFLSGAGYQLAPVTIDNQEWVFAEKYTKARARADTALVARIMTAYLEHLDESFAFYEELSVRVFGREIPQVLLLHANPLNAENLDAVVGLMVRRGYRFVSMEEALKDSAYSSTDTYVGDRGLSWLQRWALSRGIEVPAEPREPAWVAELYRQ